MGNISDKNKEGQDRAFHKLAVITLSATLLLIAVGSMVRVSGAGLGCPDWPTCWGCWIPPSDVSKIDAEKYDISQFNAAKMWIEYANRMVGVTIGFLVLATFVKSFRYAQSSPPVFWGSTAAFLLVIFNGWLGGQVVKSGLKPGIITLHMGLAVAQALALIWVVHLTRTESRPTPGSGKLQYLVVALLFVTLVQLLLGTQVREFIDFHIKDGTLPRSEWIPSLNQQDHLHRFLSWFVAGVSILLVQRTWNFPKDSATRKLASWILGLVVVEILVGIAMAYNGMPPPAQVLHLLVSAGMVCLQFMLLLECMDSHVADATPAD